VQLETDDGAVGRGEALPLPGFGLETPQAAHRCLQRCVRDLLGRELASDEALPELLDELTSLTQGAPSARGALDVALHELAACAAGTSLARWLAGSDTAHALVPVCALVAGDQPSEAADGARRRLAQGFDTLKLKVGSAPFESDLQRVSAVREAVGSRTVLRLDANGAWSEREAAEHIWALARLDIALLEQPVPAEALDALVRLRAASPIALAADEAVLGEAQAHALLEAEAVDVLVLKPAALGGLAPARRIADRAARAGVGVVVTAFLDSALGRAAALHFAAALPGEPLPAGLATADLLALDLAPAERIDRGALRVPTEPGLGVQPQPAALGRVATGPTLVLRA
jgi:o-succinylbenzoate synthase